MDAPSDRSLILDTRRGRLEAFGILVQRYQKAVYNVCLRVMGNREDAEDAVQESFLRAHRYIHTIDVERPFGPWIKQVAANHCYGVHKKRQSEPFPYELDDELNRPDQDMFGQPERVHLAREKQQRTRQAIAALPPHYRIVIELRHFQELSYQEIAAQLDLPLNTIKSHLLRARKMLLERIEER